MSRGSSQNISTFWPDWVTYRRIDIDSFVVMEVTSSMCPNIDNTLLQGKYLI